MKNVNMYVKKVKEGFIVKGKKKSFFLKELNEFK